MKRDDRCGRDQQIAKLQEEGNKQGKVLETTVTLLGVYYYLF